MIPTFVCPICKSSLLLNTNSYICIQCGKIYNIENDFYLFYSETAAYWQYYKQALSAYIISGDLPISSEFTSVTDFPYSILDKYLDNNDLQVRAALFNIAVSLAADNNLLTHKNIILEVGAGLGTDTYLLARYCPVIAVDIDNISSTGIQHIKSNVRNGITCVVASADFLPLPNNSIDMIYMLSVFHHMQDKLLALNEWYRVLKPGGILIAAGERPAETKAIKEADIKMRIFLGQWYERWYDVNDLFSWFEKSNFTEIEHIPIKCVSGMGFMLPNNLIIEKPFHQDQYICDNGIVYGRK